jgi:hypothetical protein
VGGREESSRGAGRILVFWVTFKVQSDFQSIFRECRPEAIADANYMLPESQHSIQYAITHAHVYATRLQSLLSPHASYVSPPLPLNFPCHPSNLAAYSDPRAI